MTTKKTDSKALVPQLRFPEFDGSWKKDKIQNYVDYITGYAFKSDDISENSDYDLILKATNIGEGRIKRDESTDRFYSGSLVLANKYRLLENDLVIGMDGSKVGRNSGLITKDEVNSLLIQRVARLRAKKNFPIEFIFSHINSIRFHKYVDKVKTSSGIPHISSDDIRNFKIYFPSQPEQQKIAKFLSAVDARIQTLEKKKTGLEQYKKGVMQKIFSQEIRFKDDNGNDFEDWEERRFSEVLFEHKLKSTGKEEVHSVSVHKGVINQIEHLGRSFAAKDTSKYNRVLPNDIIYTKSPTGDFPLGIIKQSHLTEDAIVSPLYGVFTPETKELGYILHVHFESNINTSNYLSSIIQKGAKNTINITNKTFLSKKMLLPVAKKEQQKIASFLTVIDTQIETVNQQLEHTKTYKKGLLQQMFV